MNDREKRLALATGVVVVVGLAVWLLGRDERAIAAKPPEAGAAPSAPATTESPRGDAGPRGPLFVSTLDLERLLDTFASPASHRDVPDPFRVIAVEPASAPPTDPELIADLPRVAALFYSSGVDRGAVLDGEVRFLGETHGRFTLTGVDASGVLLEVADRTYRVEYDPITGGGFEEEAPR